MWLDLLRDQAAQRGLGAVSLEVGYSKAALSLVLNGKYDSSTRRIETAVLRAYGALRCPFEERDLSAADCRFWRTCDRPSSSDWALRHWDACRSCPHNPSTPIPTEPR